jgi:hypothetical protein
MHKLLPILAAAQLHPATIHQHLIFQRQCRRQHRPRQPEVARFYDLKASGFPEDGRAFSRFIADVVRILWQRFLLGRPVYRLKLLKTDQVRVIAFDCLHIESRAIGPQVRKELDLIVRYCIENVKGHDAQPGHDFLSSRCSKLQLELLQSKRRFVARQTHQFVQHTGQTFHLNPTS